MSKVMMQRRRLLGAGLAAGAWVVLGPAAAQMRATPYQTKGPFYPVELPLDQDNDLTRVADRSEKARGDIVEVVGRVIDTRGRAIRDARIEIWQCNSYGRYHHPRDNRNVPLDPNFQGYGRSITTADGAYRFRTIKPVPYPGRTPHIHFIIAGPGFEPLVTQMYVAGAPENAGDYLFNRLTPAEQQSVAVVFARDTALAVPTGTFDIVLAA